MSLVDLTTWTYAALMLVGGWIGYRKAGSRASLIAGAVSALALVAFRALGRVVPAAGPVGGALVAAALIVVFGRRLARTGKWMPSGLLLVASLAALAVYAWAIAARF